VFFYALTVLWTQCVGGGKFVNIREPNDYIAMFTSLDALLAADLPQLKLYYEIGRLVGSRADKGAVAAAAEYLENAYPDSAGFSPRNLRRMRAFYQTYSSTPEVLNAAMEIRWTKM